MGKQDAPKKGNGRIVPNIGKTGLESVRIGGMTLDTLPMVEAALTKQQWPMVKKSNEQQEVDNILGRYPKVKTDYLLSRITECKENIKRIRGLIDSQNKMINEYSAHISLCAHRDREIDKAYADKEAPLDEVDAKIKSLKLQFPPYNVEAMETQIGLCKEAIERSDVVIDTEHNSIAELKEVITKCHQRDTELKPYGVRIG